MAQQTPEAEIFSTTCACVMIVSSPVRWGHADGNNVMPFSGRAGAEPLSNYEDCDARPVRCSVWLGSTCVWLFCRKDEHVPVWVANTGLARSPRLIGRW